MILQGCVLLYSFVFLQEPRVFRSLASKIGQPAGGSRSLSVTGWWRVMSAWELKKRVGLETAAGAWWSSPGIGGGCRFLSCSERAVWSVLVMCSECPNSVWCVAWGESLCMGAHGEGHARHRATGQTCWAFHWVSLMDPNGHAKKIGPKLDLNWAQIKDW